MLFVIVVRLVGLATKDLVIVMVLAVLHYLARLFTKTTMMVMVRVLVLRVVILVSFCKSHGHPHQMTPKASRAINHVGEYSPSL